MRSPSEYLLRNNNDDNNEVDDGDDDDIINLIITFKISTVSSYSYVKIYNICFITFGN